MPTVYYIYIHAYFPNVVRECASALTHLYPYIHLCASFCMCERVSMCVCMCSVGQNRRNVSAGFTSKRKIDEEKVGPAKIGISLEV